MTQSALAGVTSAQPGRWCVRIVCILALALLTGCEQVNVQSMFDPAGPGAAEIDGLWWLMFWMGTAVYGVVMGLFLIAIFRRQWKEGDDVPPLGNTGFVVTGGAAIPAVILVVLLVFALIVHFSVAQGGGSVSVEVRGHQWWWEVNYPEHGIRTANEIHVPAGESVHLELTSEDVLHSFWVPQLHGKRDLIPGDTTTFWMEADEPGIYRGQCAEYCGLQHALMAFRVVVHPPEDFDAWVAERQEPPPAPEDSLLQRGQEVFLSETCVECHRIEGTTAQGTIGPDLTHIGSRLTLGAGIIENNRGNLSGWIVNAQAIKPGNQMPPTSIDSDDLHAMVSYLLSLE